MFEITDGKKVEVEKAVDDLPPALTRGHLENLIGKCRDEKENYPRHPPYVYDERIFLLNMLLGDLYEIAAKQKIARKEIYPVEELMDKMSLLFNAEGLEETSLEQAKRKWITVPRILNANVFALSFTIGIYLFYFLSWFFRFWY